MNPILKALHSLNANDRNRIVNAALKPLLDDSEAKRLVKPLLAVPKMGELMALETVAAVGWAVLDKCGKT